MADRDLNAMSKKELMAEVQRLQQALADDQVLRATIRDLETHRDELHANQLTLAESQRLLEASRRAYAALFDFAPVGYAILDASGLVTDLNFAAARLLGAERGRLLRYPFASFLDLGERRRCLDYLRECRQMTRSGGDGSLRAGVVEAEFTVVTRDHRTLPVLLTTKQTATSGSSTPCELHTAIIDLTERRRLESERLRAEQERAVVRAESESKDHFIAVLSHELRTPLAPIRFAVASLRHAPALPDALRRALDIIDRNVEHEARMIEDLLDVTRIAQKKLHLVLGAVDVHELVHDVIATHAPELERAALHVAMHADATACVVQGDEGRLRQVVANLVRNACANTPAGGHLTVATANPSPDRLTLTIRDDGRGIARTALARLFRPFEQQVDPGRPSSGLGLGLSICKGIVEGHQGSIAAQSEGPGMGATFTVELPVTPTQRVVPEIDARTALPSAPRSGPEPVRVLLVEDNLDSAESMAALLEMFGYRVRVASSVQAALRAAEQDFDVLVSDIGLPDGTGRDLIRELTTRRPVRGIALTGYGTSEDVIKNTQAGFARHLVKPVDPDRLVAAIDEVMRAQLGDGTTGATRRAPRA